MKKLVLTLFICGYLFCFLQAQEGTLIRIETRSHILVYGVSKSQQLQQVYLGEKLANTADYAKITGKKQEAYMPFGMENVFEPALRVTHADGNPSAELRYINSESHKIDDNVTETVILLKDPQYPFSTTLHVKAYYKEDVMEQWVEIVHQEKQPITLFNYASSMLHFNATQYWLTQFHGDWAKEMRMETAPLTAGIKVIDSKLGTRADEFEAPFFYLSLNTPATENTGELVAGSIGWTGNFKFAFEVDERHDLRIISGINPFASEYQLNPSVVFKTPSFIFTYSNQGKGQASRNLHQWARKYSLLDGDQSRYTLLNNWESTFFKFDEAKLGQLMGDASKLGVDLFLLDDGWFGNKHPRNGDTAGLGDWQENKEKLPNGIGYLVKAAQEQQVKFGIWIEPEMVNPKSELYEKHPDWILKLPNREELLSRNQLILDLPNPQVQDFVFGVVDNLMQAHPGIAYIKWDCNRFMTGMFSPYLKKQQSHLYIDYTKALYAVFERVRAKYPHLPIMLCSGGGGRVDYGALKYFNEYWPSDNTDPLERVFIQWGYSQYLPAIASCNHITTWGKESLKFKTDVAMMGKMGYDLQIAHLSEQELLFSQQAVKTYKQFSDIIWYGNLYRLVSPYEENRAVLMYVSNNQTKAILFNYTLHPRYGELFTKVKLDGLDVHKNYTVKEVNLFPGSHSACPENGKTYSGNYLMKVGLTVSNATPLTSSVFEMVGVE